jgi:hypothetical protein
MNRQKIVSLTVLALLIGAVIGFVALSRVTATDDPNTMAMHEEKGMKMAKHDDKEMKEMNKCMTSCVKECNASMEDLTAVKAAIMAAMAALDKNDLPTVKSELEKADKLLTKAHKMMKENVDKMPCANGKCPISGKEFDKMSVPADHTRMYKGMKIGFCCPMCPPQWDKLSDDEKDAKLKAVMPPKE